LVPAILALGTVAWVWTQPASALRVDTQIMSPGPVTQALALNGRVVPRHEVNLRAEASGLILGVEVEEGDQVKAGDVLVRLDPALGGARLDQARAALEAQRVRERQALVTATRARALASATVSQAALDEAELTLEEARSETRRLEAALSQAESEAQQYILRAPIDGTILSRTAEPGQIATLQEDLLLLADLHDPILRTDVDELHSARIHTGMRAELLPVGRSLPLPGKVSFASPRIDTLTGGRAIEIAFDEPVDLPIGLTVAINLVVDESSDALSIPRQALALDGTSPRVMVIEDGIAQPRSIEFDDWPAARVRVTSGLKAGDVVILDPRGVKPGDKVTN